MRIAIIGGFGQMGGWLTSHFLAQQHSIIIADSKIPQYEVVHKSGVEISSSNVSAVANADVVFISVPTNYTSEVIKEVIPFMKKDAILCEISTIKSKVHVTIQNVIAKDIRILSIHPLFGPADSSLKKRFALIPVKHNENECEIFDNLFPGSDLFVTDAETHDRIMALTLSVPYFINAVLASVLKNEDLEMVERLSGTTFGTQFMLTGSIMSHNSAFHASLLKDNDFTGEVLENLLSEANQALKLFMDNVDSYEEWYKQIQSKLGESVSLTGMYREMYRTLEAMAEVSKQEGGD